MLNFGRPIVKCTPEVSVQRRYLCDMRSCSRDDDHNVAVFQQDGHWSAAAAEANLAPVPAPDPASAPACACACAASASASSSAAASTSASTTAVVAACREKNTEDKATCTAW